MQNIANDPNICLIFAVLFSLSGSIKQSVFYNKNCIHCRSCNGSWLKRGSIWPYKTVSSKLRPRAWVAWIRAEHIVARHQPDGASAPKAHLTFAANCKGYDDNIYAYDGWSFKDNQRKNCWFHKRWAAIASLGRTVANCIKGKLVGAYSPEDYG